MKTTKATPAKKVKMDLKADVAPSRQKPQQESKPVLKPVEVTLVKEKGRGKDTGGGRIIGDTSDWPQLLVPVVELEVPWETPSALTTAIYTLIDEVRELRAAVKDVSHKVDASFLGNEVIRCGASGSESSAKSCPCGWECIGNYQGESHSEPTRSPACVPLGGESPANISPITAGSSGIPSEDLAGLNIGKENPPALSILHMDPPVPQPADSTGNQLS